MLYTHSTAEVLIYVLNVFSSTAKPLKVSMATQQDRCYTSSASFPGYRPGHLSNELDNSGDCQRERSLSTDIRTIITGGFDDVSCLADAGRRNVSQ